MKHTWKYFISFLDPYSVVDLLHSLILKAPCLISSLQGLEPNFELMIFMLLLLKVVPNLNKLDPTLHLSTDQQTKLKRYCHIFYLKATTSIVLGVLWIYGKEKIFWRQNDLVDLEQVIDFSENLFP